MKLRSLAAAGLLLAVGVCAFSESAGWRLQVIERKWSGTLPHLSWREVAAGLGPCAWADCDRKLVLGRVRLAAYDLDSPCPATWDTPLGRFHGRFEDQQYLEYYSGKWPLLSREPEKYAQVREGDVVVEAGAWIGSFTRFALARGASLVVAIEPEPVSAECLRQNFPDEIRDGKVIVEEKALWEAARSLRIFNPTPERGGESAVIRETEGAVVQGAALDQIVESLGLTRVDFLNIDVEGSERRALAGAQKTIARFRPNISVCLHHLPGDREELPPMILSATPDYRFFDAGLRGHFFAPEREPRLVVARGGPPR